MDVAQICKVYAQLDPPLWLVTAADRRPAWRTDRHHGDPSIDRRVKCRDSSSRSTNGTTRTR